MVYIYINSLCPGLSLVVPVQHWDTTTAAGWPTQQMETGQWNLKTQHPDPNGQFVQSFSEPKKVKTFLNAFKYTANTNIKNCYKSSFIKTKFKFFYYFCFREYFLRQSTFGSGECIWIRTGSGSASLNRTYHLLTKYNFCSVLEEHHNRKMQRRLNFMLDPDPCKEGLNPDPFREGSNPDPFKEVIWSATLILITKTEENDSLTFCSC